MGTPRGFEKLPYAGYENKKLDLGLCYDSNKEKYVLYDNMKNFRENGEELRAIHEFNSMEDAEKFFDK